MSTPTHWQKILVPTDFSEDSLKSLREAARFLHLGTREVVLCHVTEPAFDGLRIHTGDAHQVARQEARQRLETLVDTHLGGHHGQVTTLVRDGRPGEEICELARSLGADVIFISTHGISALKHFVLGSVAEKVARHAPCSVLVVR